MERSVFVPQASNAAFMHGTHEADRAEAERLFNSDGRLCRRSPHRPFGPFINGG